MADASGRDQNFDEMTDRRRELEAQTFGRTAVGAKCQNAAEMPSKCRSLVFRFSPSLLSNFGCEDKMTKFLTFCAQRYKTFFSLQIS
jgi:hypothetical protein